MNIASIERATEKTWPEWLQFFKSIDAENLSHKDIARKVHDQGVEGWWAQTITVAYEQHIGRRKPGQVADGEYQVSVSKTIEGTMDAVFKKWREVMDKREAFSEVPISEGPSTSKTEKWRYWRCGLSDGSRVVVGICQKEPGKALLGLAHEKLESHDQIDHWRAFWKSQLERL